MKSVGAMAVREMKMIPNEIGVVCLALLDLRIGIEVSDGTISRFSAIVIMIFLSWAEFSKALTTVLKFSTEICNSVIN